MTVDTLRVRVRVFSWSVRASIQHAVSQHCDQVTMTAGTHTGKPALAILPTTLS